MSSTALIPVAHNPVLPADRAPADLVPLQGSEALLHRGPGLSMLQLAEYGGKGLESLANRFFRGPNGPKSRIERFFGEGDAMQRALDELYADCDSFLTHKTLRRHCHDLLRFAHPRTQTVDTQLVTFKILTAIITRYPGIRRVLYNDKAIRKTLAKDTSLESIWRRSHQPCGEEWELYRQLAVFCISNSALTELVEDGRPSELVRMELDDTLSKVPIESLQGFCRSGPDFDPSRLAAIQYLAGILELPAMLVQAREYPSRLSEILSKRCLLRVEPSTFLLVLL
ncbi:hypothetical protein C8R43DRAFT_1034182 [Mycena crocata]|nr:hypothetical protein C8R43DRAFT_1034182 [Mycena crocata]